MESSSTIYTSPSFNRDSSNNIADIADRVVHELLSSKSFNHNDLFIFSDDEDNISDTYNENDVNMNTFTQRVNEMSKKKEATPTPNEDPQEEFEFPVTPTDEFVSKDIISPQYPLFDRSLLLSNVNNNDNNNNKNNICNEVVVIKPVVPAKRSSLMKLFSEDRDTASSTASYSTSSSEAEPELEGITPGSYCVWKPKKAEKPGVKPKHKKSNSVSIGNTSNRWKVLPDLLKRSYSDDNYSATAGKDSPVIVFLPPISPNQRKKTEKVKKVSDTAKVVSAKTEKKVPAYKAKIGNIRLPPYLPYRQDQVAAFAGFTEPNKRVYRY